jgi:hypothetical protein
MLGILAAIGDTGRVVDEVTFKVVAPPAYERAIAAVANLVVVPLSWTVGLLNGDPPLGLIRPQHQVQVVNRHGKRRGLAMVDTAEEAHRRRDAIVARVRRIGLQAWRAESPIPDSFFGD